MLQGMTGLSDHAREQIELHRTVAHMYRQRSAYAFAREFQDERNAILMSLAPPAAAGLAALDLGCGTGITLDLLVERYGRAVGLDASQEMLEGYPEQAHDTVGLVRGDMHALPFVPHSVDVIVCRSALHHMEDEVAVLRQIASALRPGGRLILGEPANDNVLTRLARWWVRRRPSYGKVHTIDRAYTRGQLRALLAAADLEVIREVRFGFFAYPLCDNPELVPVLKVLPFASALAGGLRALDRLLARIPLIRSQSWYAMLEVGHRAEVDNP